MLETFNRFIVYISKLFNFTKLYRNIMKIAQVCPSCTSSINAKCIIYDGPVLSTINVTALTTLDVILGNINSSVLQVSNASEKLVNKSTNIIANSGSNTKYPSVNAVFTWATGTFQPLLGFTAENVANKVINKTAFIAQGGSSVAYPSVKSVKDYVDDAISAIPIPDLQQVTTAGNQTTVGMLVDDGTGINVLELYAGVARANDFGSGEFVQIDKDSVTFNNGTFSVNVISPFQTAARTINVPNASGTLTLSVNGNTANSSGQITIPDPYRVYVAEISMVDGTVLNLLKNTLGDTLTWVSIVPGSISTLSGVLASENNTVVFVTSKASIPKIVSAEVNVSSIIWGVIINQIDSSGSPTATDSVFVEIRVY